MAEQHTTAAEVEESVLHESAHYGARQLFGKDLERAYTALWYKLGGSKAMEARAKEADPAWSTKNTTELYRLAKLAVEAHTMVRDAAKTGETDLVRKTLEQKRQLLATRGILVSGRDALSALRKQADAVKKRRDLTAEAKRDQLDAITRRQNEIAKRVVEQARQAVR